MPRVIFWDVDTQYDFMKADGKLYVPDAEQLVGNLKKLTDYAHGHGIRIIASADDHVAEHAEISATPDWKETFPPHCLRGTAGAEKIGETKQADPLPLSHLPYPPGLLPGLVQNRGEILLLKKNFDVFTNPNADALLTALDPHEVIVFGVATDVCDDAVIRGLLRRGRRVRFVEDAARGLDEVRVASCTAAWRQGGVTFTTADEVVAELA